MSLQLCDGKEMVFAQLDAADRSHVECVEAGLLLAFTPKECANDFFLRAWSRQRGFSVKDPNSFLLVQLSKLLSSAHPLSLVCFTSEHLSHKKWHRILGLDSKISFYFPLRFWSSRYLTVFVASQSLKNYYFACKAVQQVKTPAVLMT